MAYNVRSFVITSSKLNGFEKSNDSICSAVNQPRNIEPSFSGSAGLLTQPPIGTIWELTGVPPLESKVTMYSFLTYSHTAYKENDDVITVSKLNGVE